MQRPTETTPDIAERGAEGSSLDRRLFMQLLVFTGCDYPGDLIGVLERQPFETVLYEDVNDPAGVALLTLSEDPSLFVGGLRRMLRAEPFDGLTLRPGYTMLGRSYSLGYERDLEETLLRRPRRHALMPDWPWAIWYPLRRKGGFTQLPAEEQKAILMEHGRIGMAFGQADYAHDIRLACHGLDAADNDFVIGLLGRQLHPLSAIVQRMRSTKQTSTWLEKLGPFFVGKAAWQSPLKE